MKEEGGRMKKKKNIQYPGCVSKPARSVVGVEAPVFAWHFVCSLPQAVSENVRDIPLDDRDGPTKARGSLLSGRIPIGALLAAGTASMSSLHHSCGAGIKWFENYGAFFISVVVLFAVLAWRRAVIGISVAILIGSMFDFVVGPAYLNWIHSPNAPRWVRASWSPRILEDLRIIDQATDSAQAAPAKDQIAGPASGATPVIEPSGDDQSSD
jgi:hypothetical protein